MTDRIGQPKPKPEPGIRPSKYNPKIPVWLVAATLLALCVGVYAFVNQQNDGFRRYVRRTHTISNMKQLAAAIEAYREGSDGLFPPASSWTTATKLFRKNDNVLLDDTAQPPCSFMFFEPLSSRNPDLLDNSLDTPLLFQTDIVGDNAYGSLADLPKNPRGSNGGDIYTFADGHTKMHRRSWAAIHNRATFK
jgi:hypothetical protein